jgi:hypothetical protein
MNEAYRLATEHYLHCMFGFHPVNLGFRFVLELAAFVALAIGGYAIGSGASGWVFAIGLPIAGATAWGTFNVPGDRSRNGEAPVPVPGVVRLLVELGVFGVAIIVVWFANPVYALTLLAGVVIHYALSVDRIKWLLAN